MGRVARCGGPARSAALAFLVSAIVLGGGWSCAAERGSEAERAGAGLAPLVVGVPEALAPALRPALDGFAGESGLAVEVRADEGAAADLVIAGDGATIGGLVSEGRARRLPPDILGLVPDGFRPPGGEWVALSVRVRAVVYNAEAMGAGILPDRLSGLSAERFDGRFALAPESPSFEFHMAAYRIVNGAEAVGEILEGMAARRPQLHADEAEVVDAVRRGAVWFGLVDHAAMWPVLTEDPSAPLRDFFMTGEDASATLVPTAAALTSDRREARDLLRYLLAEERQRELAAATFEYPAQRIGADVVQLVPLSRLEPARVELEEVAAVLPEVRAAIAAAGLSR